MAVGKSESDMAPETRRATKANLRKVKAWLAQRIIDKRGLTQEVARRNLGISQPKVSAIIKGRLNGFSTERLFRILNVPGCDVKISVSRPHPATPGQVTVI
jgi:predicted XRE-type DNA-binding protein